MITTPIPCPVVGFGASGSPSLIQTGSGLLPFFVFDDIVAFVLICVPPVYGYSESVLANDRLEARCKLSLRSLGSEFPTLQSCQFVLGAAHL